MNSSFIKSLACTVTGLGAFHRLFPFFLTRSSWSSCCRCPFLQTGKWRPEPRARRGWQRGWRPGSRQPHLFHHSPAPPTVHSWVTDCVIARGNGTTGFKAGLGPGWGEPGTDPAAVPKPTSYFLEACFSSKVSNPASTLVAHNFFFASSSLKTKG